MSSPFGFRPASSEEDDDGDVTDDVLFRDQLQSEYLFMECCYERYTHNFLFLFIALGLFGRAVLVQSIEVLTTIFSQLIGRFESFVAGTSDRAVGSELYEDMHWALLIAGHLLAYETENETNLIPKESKSSLTSHFKITRWAHRRCYFSCPVILEGQCRSATISSVY